MFGEMAEGAGDRVDDGVAAAGEGEVGEAHHFLPGEAAVAISGLSERAEKICAGVGLGGVEFPVEVVFEDVAGFEFTAGDLEHVDAPADPDFGLGRGHVEQIGQCAGLHGQGKLVDDLDGLTGES